MDGGNQMKKQSGDVAQAMLKNTALLSSGRKFYGSILFDGCWQNGKTDTGNAPPRYKTKTTELPELNVQLRLFYLMSS